MTDAQRPIRVLIADDSEELCDLLTLVIADEPTLELVGIARNAGQAIELAAEHEPDVALVDWMMPGGGGAHAARRMGHTRVVALTGSGHEQAEDEMRGAGAVGFVLKGSPIAEVVDAIHAAMSR